jgi:hypothetical protein
MHVRRNLKPYNLNFYNWNQCCGSGRIRNFLQDLDPELKVMDPDPASDPELDLKLIKNHQKISDLIIMTLILHLY